MDKVKFGNGKGRGPKLVPKATQCISSDAPKVPLPQSMVPGNDGQASTPLGHNSTPNKPKAHLPISYSAALKQGINKPRHIAPAVFTQKAASSSTLSSNQHTGGQDKNVLKQAQEKRPTKSAIFTRKAVSSSQTLSHNQHTRGQDNRQNSPEPAISSKAKLSTHESKASNKNAGKRAQPVPNTSMPGPRTPKVKSAQSIAKDTKSSYAAILKQGRQGSHQPSLTLTRPRSPSKKATPVAVETSVVNDSPGVACKTPEKPSEPSAAKPTSPSVDTARSMVLSAVGAAAEETAHEVDNEDKDNAGNEDKDAVDNEDKDRVSNEVSNEVSNAQVHGEGALATNIVSVDNGKEIIELDGAVDAERTLLTNTVSDDKAEELFVPDEAVDGKKTKMASMVANDNVEELIVPHDALDDEKTSVANTVSNDKGEEVLVPNRAVDGEKTLMVGMVSDDNREQLVLDGSNNTTGLPQSSIPFGPPESLDGCGPIFRDSEPNKITKGRLVPLIWTSLPDERNTRFYGRLCRSKPEVDRACTMCTGQGTAHCRGCKARYCSVACQNKDWPAHKKVCREFGRLEGAPKPSKNHFSALLLPSGTKMPQLVYSVMGNGGYSLVDCSESEDKDGNVGYAYHINGGLGLRKPFLGHGLALIQLSSLPSITEIAINMVNKTIHDLASPGALRPHLGPFMVIAFQADDRGIPKKPIDINPADWRHVVDFLRNHAGNSIWPPEAGLNALQKCLMGAKLNDIRHPLISKALGVTKAVENVLVPAHDCTIAGPAALAFQIGLPWKVRYTCWEPSWATGSEMKYLDWYFEPEPSPGSTGRKWKAKCMAGCLSIIIVSMADDRCVHSHHIQAFQKFMSFTLSKDIAPSRSGFMKYWEVYHMINKADVELGIIASPYSSLPKIDELSSNDTENQTHSRAIMNLLGNFDARGWVMETREEDNSIVPHTSDVEYDTEGNFEFSKEDMKIPSGTKQHFI